MHEMSATAQEVARHAADAAHAANDADDSARQGSTVMQSTIATITDIRGEIANTAEVIRRLQLCAEAGADSVYPVAMPDTETLKRVVAEVPLPLNVTAKPVDGAIPDGLGLAQLTEIGVKRVSFGPLLQAALRPQFAEVTRAWH